MGTQPSSREPIAIVLTGISGAGKSTTAIYLRQALMRNGFDCRVITFDKFRSKLLPLGAEKFPAAADERKQIYVAAIPRLIEIMETGTSIILDAAISLESCRTLLRGALPNASLVYLTCPLWVAMSRETKRSVRQESHDRGHFLYIRALGDWINPFVKDKFPQSGITCTFERPCSPDIRVSTLFKTPLAISAEIIAGLGLDRKDDSIRSTMRHPPSGSTGDKLVIESA